MYYTFSFFIPNIIRRKPPKNLGLLTNTTFINSPPLIFATRQSKQYYPDCKYGYQKFRRTKAAYEQAARKRKS